MTIAEYSSRKGYSSKCIQKMKILTDKAKNVLKKQSLLIYLIGIVVINGKHECIHRNTSYSIGKTSK